VRYGLYAEGLERFWRHWDHDRFLYRHMDEVGSASTMSEIHRFLGVEPRDFEARTANVGLRRRSSSTRWVYAAARRSGLRSLVPASQRRRLRPAVARLNAVGRAVGPTTLTADQQRRLIDLYAPDADRLEKETGLDLSGWRATWDEVS
jgi:hypothetical protein